MKKILFLAFVLIAFSSEAKSKKGGDYTCTVKVVYGGKVTLVTASSDISYQDACKKAYAQAMLEGN